MINVLILQYQNKKTNNSNTNNMEFIFDKEKENKAWKYIIDDKFIHADGTQQTKVLAETFTNRLSAIGTLKSSVVGIEIMNDTLNEDGKYNDCFYRKYIVNDLNELQTLVSTLAIQLVNRCEKLCKGNEKELDSSSLIKVHKYIGNIAPQAGRMEFLVEVISKYLNEYGRPLKRIFRTYVMKIEINEFSDNWDNIFNQ